MPIYEIHFKVKTQDHPGQARKDNSFRDMHCLVEADNEASALSIILSVWAPPGEILHINISKNDRFFQVLVPKFSDGLNSEPLVGDH